MTDLQYLKLKVQLGVLKTISKSYKYNTTVDTIIREMEAKIKYIDNQNKSKE